MLLNGTNVCFEMLKNVLRQKTDNPFFIRSNYGGCLLCCTNASFWLWKLNTLFRFNPVFGHGTIDTLSVSSETFWFQNWTYLTKSLPPEVLLHRHFTSIQTILLQRDHILDYLVSCCLCTNKRKKMLVGMQEKIISTVFDSQRSPFRIHCWSDTLVQVSLG